jgi:hypothetical protein
MKPEDEIESVIETGVGKLYNGFYRLRKSEQYQREYDTMGTIINMLMKDRQHIRETYKVEL